MKRLLLLIIFFSFFATAFAQHNIQFKFKIRFQSTQYVWSTITVIDSSSFTEGSSYTIPAFEIPSGQSYLQPAYNAIVGATFGVDEGALNNDIRLEITLNGLDLNGRYQNVVNSLPLFLVLDVKVYDPADSPTPLEDNFWFNTGHFMTFTIPVTDDFVSFIQSLELSPAALAFAYIVGNEFVGDNITTKITAEQISFEAAHLSSFGGGGSEIVSVEKTDDIPVPKKYVLNQNYPNPFNPTTKISFSIPQSDFVTLKVYNTLGVEVKTLISEKLSSGNYSLDYNAQDIPSGVYFYALKGNNISLTKKMILLK